MNMDSTKNEMERNVFLTDEQAKQMLADFYRSVAQTAGYEEKEDTLYDCCRILVSADVHDAIIQAYQERQPGIPMESIITVLAIGGPKMDAALGKNEVKIQPGFIGSKSKN